MVLNVTVPYSSSGKPASFIKSVAGSAFTLNPAIAVDGLGQVFVATYRFNSNPGQLSFQIRITVYDKNLNVIVADKSVVVGLSGNASCSETETVHCAGLPSGGCIIAVRCRSGSDIIRVVSVDRFGNFVKQTNIAASASSSDCVTGIASAQNNKFVVSGINGLFQPKVLSFGDPLSSAVGFTTGNSGLNINFSGTGPRTSSGNGRVFSNVASNWTSEVFAAIWIRASDNHGMLKQFKWDGTILNELDTGLVLWVSSGANFASTHISMSPTTNQVFLAAIPDASATIRLRIFNAGNTAISATKDFTPSATPITILGSTFTSNGNVAVSYRMTDGSIRVSYFDGSLNNLYTDLRLAASSGTPITSDDFFSVPMAAASSRRLYTVCPTSGGSPSNVYFTQLDADPDTATNLSDSWIVKPATKTHTSSANLKSTTTSSYASSAYVPFQITVPYSTSAYLLSTVTKGHTSSASLLATVTTGHTSSAQLRSTITTGHTSSADLLATVTAGHTSSAQLQSTVTTGHTSSADLLATVTAPYSSSGLIQSTVDVSSTFDASLIATVDKTHSSSAVLQKLNITDPYSSSALLQKQVDSSFTTSSYLLSTVTGSYASSGLLSSANDVSYSSSASVVQRDIDTSMSSSANLIERDATRSHAFTAELFSPGLGTYLSSANLLKEETRSYTSDADLIARDITQSNNSSAILVGTVTSPYISSANLQKEETSSYASNASLLAQVTESNVSSALLMGMVTSPYISSASLQQEQTSSHTSDANLLFTATSPYSSSANLQASVTSGNTSSANLRATNTAPYVSDAFLAIPTRTFNYQSSASLMATISPGYASSGLLIQTQTLNHTSSGLLQKVEDKTFQSSANLRQTLTKGYLSDSSLIGRIDQFISFDAILEKRNITKFHSSSALLAQLGITSSFNSSASLRQTIAVTYGSSANLLKSVSSTWTSSASLIATGSSSHSSSAYLVHQINSDMGSSAQIHRYLGLVPSILNAPLKDRTRAIGDGLISIAPGSASMAKTPNLVFSAWIEDFGNDPCNSTSDRGRQIFGRIDSHSFIPLTDTIRLSSLLGWEGLKVAHYQQRWIVVYHTQSVIKYSVFDENLNVIFSDRTVAMHASIVGDHFDAGVTESGQLFVSYDDHIVVCDIENNLVSRFNVPGFSKLGVMKNIDEAFVFRQTLTGITWSVFRGTTGIIAGPINFLSGVLLSNLDVVMLGDGADIFYWSGGLVRMRSLDLHGGVGPISTLGSSPVPLSIKADVSPSTVVVKIGGAPQSILFRRDATFVTTITDVSVTPHHPICATDEFSVWLMHADNDADPRNIEMDILVTESVYMGQWRVERSARIFAADFDPAVAPVYEFLTTRELGGHVAVEGSLASDYLASPGRSAVNVSTDSFADYFGTEDEDTIVIGGPLGSEIADKMISDLNMFNAQVGFLSVATGMSAIDFVSTPGDFGYNFDDDSPAVHIQNAHGSFLLKRHQIGSVIHDYGVILRMPLSFGQNQTDKSFVFIAGINARMTFASSYVYSRPLEYRLGFNLIYLVVAQYPVGTTDYQPGATGSLRAVDMSLVNANNYY